MFDATLADAKGADDGDLSTATLPECATSPETYAAMLRDVAANRVIFDAIFYRIAEDKHLNTLEICKIAQLYSGCTEHLQNRADAFFSIELGFLERLRSESCPMSTS